MGEFRHLPLAERNVHERRGVSRSPSPCWLRLTWKCSDSVWIGSTAHQKYRCRPPSPKWTMRCWSDLHRRTGGSGSRGHEACRDRIAIRSRHTLSVEKLSRRAYGDACKARLQTEPYTLRILHSVLRNQLDRLVTTIDITRLCADRRGNQNSACCAVAQISGYGGCHRVR